MSDRLIFEAEGRLFGFETAQVHKILETDRIYFLPGQSSPVSGVVTLSGAPITVLDIFALLCLRDSRQSGPEQAQPAMSSRRFHRIVVLKEGEKIIGLDIGSAELSFALEDAPAEEIDKETGTKPQEAAVEPTKKNIELRERDIEDLDWLPYFDMAADILSTNRANG